MAQPTSSDGSPLVASCKWPNGEVREVVVTSIVNGLARVIWNESLRGSGCGGMSMGCEEVVPAKWLSASWLDLARGIQYGIGEVDG